MKNLYIVRHAKSSWDFPELSDFDRPLNQRGEKAAPEMGRRFKERGIRPGLILSSPAKRAITTARIIAAATGYPLTAIKQDADLYMASAQETLQIVQQVADKHDSLMIFGHNPGFTNFAAMITGREFDNVPTAGVVAADLKIDHWADAAWYAGQLTFFDFPRRPFLT